MHCLDAFTEIKIYHGLRLESTDQKNGNAIMLQKYAIRMRPERDPFKRI